ncbi:MAG: M48 family metalloprotease [Calditrichaeota bacterium]|nr:M48 family metalloprotease [Calditrichota bacterium]
MWNRTRTKIAIFLFLLISFAWIVSCAVNPVTGKKELMLMSESQEIQLGKQSDQSVIQTYGLYKDPKLETYIESLGQKLARLSDRPKLAFHFRLLDSPVVNAFAIPGGYVYITRGILAYLNNEAELAGVLGHEIGHIAARHSAKQYSQSQLVQLGFGLAYTFSEEFRKYAGLTNLGVNMLFLKFSRDNERQADQLGVKYSSEAGYNALEMADFFKTLDRMQPSGQQALPDWFTTHPNPKERIQNVRKLARQWQAKLGKKHWIIHRNAYLQRLNGLVFGDDPRQGFVEDGIFYHPAMRFYFPVPAGWKLVNTHAQVQMVSPKKDAVILFTLAKGQTPQQAADAFIKESKGSVLSSDPMRLQGYPAHRVIETIETDTGKLKIMSLFIKKGTHIFVFHSYTQDDLFPGYRKTFQATMFKFNRMTNPRRIQIKPNRIYIRKVARTSSLEQALKAFGVSGKDREKLALLNGMKLTDTVQAGTLLKIVKKGR